MYKVFINDNPLFFCENMAQLDGVENVNYFSFQSNSTFYDTVISLLSNKNTICCVLAENLKNAFDSFFESYVKIEAAGGVVENSKQQLLFIYRNGIWDLPKGKIEFKENKRVAAVREVEEECGLVNPVITADALSTYHTYLNNDKLILKKTYWFFMTYNGGDTFTPQIEEGITKVKWMNFEEIINARKETFKSIVDVIDACLNKNS